MKAVKVSDQVSFAGKRARSVCGRPPSVSARILHRRKSRPRRELSLFRKGSELLTFNKLLKWRFDLKDCRPIGIQSEICRISQSSLDWLGNLLAKRTFFLSNQATMVSVLRIGNWPSLYQRRYQFTKKILGF